MTWQDQQNKITNAAIDHALATWDRWCDDPHCPMCRLLSAECKRRGIPRNREGSARTEPSSLLTTTQQKEVP